MYEYTCKLFCPLSLGNTDFYQYWLHKIELLFDLGSRPLYSEEIFAVFSSTWELRSGNGTKPVSITNLVSSRKDREKVEETRLMK